VIYPCFQTGGWIMKRLVPVLLLGFASSLFALIGETPTIRKVAVICPSEGTVDPKMGTYALIGDVPAGRSLILRTINKADGTFAGPDQTAFVPGGTAAPMIYSRLWLPGNILILREDGSLLAYPVAFDADGTAKLIGDTPTIFDSFIEQQNIATALAEAPGFLGIGTSSGRLYTVNTNDLAIETIELRKGEVTALTTVPQVGYFAFAAAVGGHVVGVNPNNSTVMFDLVDPRPEKLLDVTGAVFEPNTEALIEPAPVPILTANGTTEVTTLMIPANPTIGGMLTVGNMTKLSFSVVEVDLGSLAMRTAEGAVVLDPNFSMAHGGSDVNLVVAGAVLDLDPDTLNLRSRGNSVSALCANEYNNAREIDTNTLALNYGGSSVPALSSTSGDADNNLQSDVMARFDRAAVQAMLKNAPEGPVTLTLRWRFKDTSAGSASGVIRVKR